MDTTSDGVYRRCGCTDPASRRRLGRRCPRLADPEHGSWYFAVQILGTGGRRRRLRRGGFASSRQAAAARQRVLADTAVGAAGQGWTVARWLRHWLSTLPLQVRPSTAAGYRAHAEEHLIPYLGRHTLARLTVGHLEAMFADIAAHSTRDGQPVTAATLQRIRATLRRALNVAVREQLLEVNPARLVLLPRPVRHRPLPWSPARVAAWRRSGEHPKVAVWTPLQLARFLATVREDWLFALWWLAALRAAVGRRRRACRHADGQPAGHPRRRPFAYGAAEDPRRAAHHRPGHGHRCRAARAPAPPAAVAPRRRLRLAGHRAGVYLARRAPDRPGLAHPPLPPPGHHLRAATGAAARPTPRRRDPRPGRRHRPAGGAGHARAQQLRVHRRHLHRGAARGRVPGRRGHRPSRPHRPRSRHTPAGTAGRRHQPTHLRVATKQARAGRCRARSGPAVRPLTHTIGSSGVYQEVDDAG